MRALSGAGRLAHFHSAYTEAERLQTESLALALAAASLAAQPVTLIEYYQPLLDHYFITSLQPDIDALDSGHFFGWPAAKRPCPRSGS